MLDFLEINTRSSKHGVTEIYPSFLIMKSKDLMIRGGDFYAIWVEDVGLWSMDEDDLIALVDREVLLYYEKKKNEFDGTVKCLLMRHARTGIIDDWHKYCKHQCRDNFHTLDENIVWANDPVKKELYSSHRLPYALLKGGDTDLDAYNELIDTLYSAEEKRKIEWAIGAVVTGASKTIQKFLVFYGSAGTGKSTILNIIQMLFEGYYSVFDAKALGSSTNAFALEPFKNNPLVAIQHDGDLSKIEDNTRLNSLVSHESMIVNEKFKSTYANRFKAFLFMGTNKPVKITDAKSGLIRRLIDVSPTGETVPYERYKELINDISFHLGSIAWHCKEVYESDPSYYDNYIPINMMGASNDFYNFIEDSYMIFSNEDSTTLKNAWEMYRTYCDDARVQYPLSQRAFKEELKNYFWEYNDRVYTEEGRVRSLYKKFRKDKFDITILSELSKQIEDTKPWLEFNCTKSLLDDILRGSPAQYATATGKPKSAWSNVTTTLGDIDTSKLHYVRLPVYHIVIDFDIPDETGEKNYQLNYEAALKWPKTYAELSRSGKGIHLHYIYTGDPTKLENKYDEHIEIKVFAGNSALRRAVSKCNDIPIATISSGLPMKKGGKVVINEKTIQNEENLKKLIARCLKKEFGATKPSIDFIKKILDDAYDSGMRYDVHDIRPNIVTFALHSTNNKEYCCKVVEQMKFSSADDIPNTMPVSNDGLWFYDIEVFPNLVLVNYKLYKDPVMYRLINPTAAEIRELIKKNLIGFNCRRYDNHILYAIMMGYSVKEVYELSKRIINGDRNCFFKSAYDISYTDIYDMASNANKMSLKKLEIKMDIHHQELGYDWDKPVPEEDWVHVSEYCDNDVIATEKAFDYLVGDWVARQILAELTGMTYNDTTNSLTTNLIFGNERNPQREFQYRDLSKPVDKLDPDVEAFLKEACPEMMSETHCNDGISMSILPYFPGYKYEKGVSTYKGYTVGEGGFVYAEPGAYENVALLDVASMHPHSIIAECLFGPRFTRIFREVVEGRVSIKHKAWDELDGYLGGRLKPFIQRVINGEFTAKQLANALKTAINSIYGLTDASFDNPFKDRRNIDNIVAKRGALFMIDLKEQVEMRGFKVAHIKTDSIKIPNATPYIIDFVYKFGKKYGYTFEHEATYDRMCLVNNAVYIAKYATTEKCNQLYGYLPEDNKEAEETGHFWTATGTQFAVPYVFKRLFSKEDITFKDKCEVKQVSKGAIYLKDGDNYIFVGRVGQFCPMKPGAGKEMYCLRDEKYYSVAGTKGYLWRESEEVKDMSMEDLIDVSYYEELCEEAKKTICQYIDYDIFVSDNDLNLVMGEEIPFK